MPARSSSRASTNSKSRTNNKATKQDDSDVVSVCSKASIGTNEDEDDDFMDDKDENSFTLPVSDLSYHRKIFIMKSGSNTGEIHRLPHPKFGRPVLFMIDKEGNPFESMKIEQGQKRSIFVGDSVISDPGAILLFLPVHPLFLILPLLQESKETFLSLDQLLDESPLKLLSNSEKLVKALPLVTEFEESKGTKKFRLNEDQLVSWLKIKFASLIEAVRKNVVSVEGRGGENFCLSDVFLDHYSMGILSDYLTPSTDKLLRSHLLLNKEDEIKEYSSIDTSTRKRAFQQPKKIVPTKKRPSKFAQVATTGMKSLRTFFGKKPNDNNVEFLKKETPNQQHKSGDHLSSFNTCTDTSGIKRNNGEEWIASDYFVMLCHKISNESSWPIMRIEVVACLREDKKTRISIGSQVEEYPGKFLVCRRDNPNDLTGIVHREWRYIPLPKSLEEANTCFDNEGKRRQNGEEWIVGTYFVMLCHQVLSNQSSWLIMQVEIIACLREDLKTRIPVGSEVEETPGRFLVCRRTDSDPTGIVWREWRIGEAKKPVETDKTCLDNEGKGRQNGEEWIVSDYFVFTCHQVLNQNSLPTMQVEVIACLRDDRITRIPVGSEVEESPGKFLVCRKVDPNDPAIMVRREWRIVVNPQPANVVKTCLDNEGKTRKDGEEWIVGDYFVFLCHQIPSNPVPIMVAQVVACLREDRQSRIAVGSEVEESPGMILSCKRADPNDPNGIVRREW
uniref:Ribonuclease H2 subunit B n=1 Tax=Meloidogyne javanica TaxID=6303 RepID=A0A915LHV6_MELJA